MEKFGIFELLDALSQITADQNQAVTPQSPEPSDSAFTPPSYENTGDTPVKKQPSAPTQEAAPAPQRGDPSKAFEEFLSRHNRISEQIDKK